MIDPKLKTLLCVVKEGSYTKAAELLALSQPAVSYHVRQLEDELGIKVFYRNQKKLTLTPEGEVLIKFARRLEAISDSARRALADVKQQLRHFTVGITPSCGEALIGRVFSNYCGAHPHTNISIVTDTMEQLCGRFYLSSSYICRIFKAATGTTINKYITARRISIAKAQLNAGSSVFEAFERSGFSDYSNFFKAFTKAVGVSPKKYANLSVS